MQSGKVSVKMDNIQMGNSSALGIESSALRDVGGMSFVPVASLFGLVCMAVSSSRMVKGGSMKWLQLLVAVPFSGGAPG